MTKKELEEALIDASQLVSREGATPDKWIMSVDDFVSICMEQGLTKEEAELLVIGYIED